MQNKNSEKFPLVTIITPTFNHGEFLESAILSVKNQIYPHIEHLIFDAGSQDSTVKILKSYESAYPMKWVSEKDSGMSEAINKGIRRARGEIIAWLNADDVLMYRDSIERVVEAYLRMRRPDIIVGDMAFLEKSGNVIQMYGYPKITYEYILSGAANIGQPSVFIRSELLRQNLLREDLHYAMDFELWVRIGKNARFGQIRRVLSGSRMYPGTKSSNPDRYWEEKSLVLSEHPHPMLKERSPFLTKIAHVYSIKLRGFLLLVLHKYVLRSKRAAPTVRYRPFPKDIMYQLFRKMRQNYEGYWPPYIVYLIKVLYVPRSDRP